MCVSVCRCVSVCLCVSVRVSVWVCAIAYQLPPVLRWAPAGARSPLCISIPWSSHLAQKKLPQAEK